MRPAHAAGQMQAVGEVPRRLAEHPNGLRFRRPLQEGVIGIGRQEIEQLQCIVRILAEVVATRLRLDRTGAVGRDPQFLRHLFVEAGSQRTIGDTLETGGVGILPELAIGAEIGDRETREGPVQFPVHAPGAAAPGHVADGGEIDLAQLLGGHALADI